MIKFGEDLNNFSFDFTFKVKTGQSNWSTSFIYQEDISGYTEPSEVSDISTASTSINLQNDYLLMSNHQNQEIKIYQNINDYFFLDNNITGNNIESNGGFGYALDFADNNVYVGAPFVNQNSGQVFVFSKSANNGIGVSGSSSFGQIREIINLEKSGFFGSYISAMQNTTEKMIAISATGESNGGAVYVYTNGGITFKDKIVNSTSGVNFFGKHTKLFNINEIKFLTISYELNQTGRVDLYKKDSTETNFSLRQSISSSNAHSGNYFGNQVIFTNDKLFISSPKENNSGAVYEYNYNYDSELFEETKRFQETNVENEDFFGKNIVFNESLGIITSNQNSGKAYLYNYQNDQWKNHAEIEASENVNSGSWGGNLNNGFCVDLLNDEFMIASYNEAIAKYYENPITLVGQDLYTGFTFSGSEGKLRDLSGRFVYGYNPDSLVRVSGDVFDEDLNLSINGQLINSIDQRRTGVLNSYEVSGAEDLSYYSVVIGK